MRISHDKMAKWQLGSQENALLPLIPPRDYSGLNRQNETLRVWLPEPAKQALQVICERLETSMTVYLTEYFAEYLYGYYELLGMREQRTGLYEPLAPEPARRSCAQILRYGSQGRAGTQFG